MTTINSIFVAMWEAHRGNWETLFAAMRHLDVAREALGLSAAGITMTDRKSVV